MKTLKEMYANQHPIGGYQICNTAGLAVFEVLREDPAYGEKDYVTAWSNSEGYSNFSHCNVRSTASGKNFIMKGQQRFYLSEIARL